MNGPGFLALPGSFGGGRKACSLGWDCLFFIWRCRLADGSCHNFPGHVDYIFLFFDW